jgi:hypothetical protein
MKKVHYFECRKIYGFEKQLVIVCTGSILLVGCVLFCFYVKIKKGQIKNEQNNDSYSAYQIHTLTSVKWMLIVQIFINS